MTSATVDLAGNTAAVEAIRYVLQTHIMFNVLPITEKRQIEPLFQVRQYQAGETLAHQGRPVDGMYIVYGGTARLKEHVNDKVVSVGTIGEGATFGEMSLLDAAQWPNDVLAEDRLTVIVLPAEAARAITAQNKVIEEHFKRFVGLIKVGERLRALLEGGACSPEQFAEILGELGVKKIREGGTVFRQGDSDPRLYYVESGRIDLLRQPLDVPGEPISLARVRRGTLIGEAGALPRPDNTGMQPYTAKALTEVTVLVIYQHTVQKILAINPGLHDRLRLRVRELEQQEREEIATRKRVEGVDLRVKLADGITEDEFRASAKRKEVAGFAIVRQSAASECAAACLTMVVNHYGKPFKLGQMKEITGLDMASVTPDQVIRGAETLGFRAKGYALTWEDLQGARLPGIIGWQGYHWAVVTRITDRHVEIADPAGGIKKIKKADFLPSWTAATVAGVFDIRPDAGVFIALEPTVAFEKEEDPKSSVRHFVNYILPHKKYYAEAVLAALVINLLGMASPLFVQTIVDTVVVHKDASLLNTMLAGMVLVAVLTTLMTVVQSLLLAHTTARLDMRMMSEFYRHILSLPMDFFMKRNKGEILARFGENQKIRAILTGSTITVLMNSLMIVLYFMMMFAYNQKLTIIVIVFIPVYIGIVVYFTPRIKAIAQEIFLTNSQSQSYLIESLNSIETIKATANEYFARARWESAFVDNVNRSFRQQKLQLMSSSLFKLATLASSIAVLWLGATEVMNNHMTIGELMGFNMLMGLVTGPVLQMVDLWNQLLEVRISVDRVGDVLGVKPEHQTITRPDKVPATLSAVEGRIIFEKVNFGYVTNDKTKYIMRDFDLVIEPGDRVAFVGPAGCGKSTIAKMVLGFYKPISGRILIDGKDTAEMDLNSLRRNIGVVLQDTFLFGGTVAENIALGDPEPDMESVREAAKKAHAEEFILEKPNGYQTPIGEKGIQLSGGQRQRIGIARALYRRPKIMIFDEATSALDNETEELVINDLKPILQSRTSIAIAHRLTTIIGCTYICYIRDGKVQEKGAHEQLIDKEYLRERGYTGLYYELARSAFSLPPLDLS